MFKQVKVIIAAMVLTAPLAVQAGNSDVLVEVMLIDALDDARGYCLDIAGGRGKDAPLDKGLQAHTCYHYTGGILEDQGFDSALINQGQFKIPYFDVCMSVSALEQGEAIKLAECNQQETQQFSLNPKGQLVAQAASNLCVTVDSKNKKEGRGGSPVHVMRPLTLQSCDESQNTYQLWSINKL